jgi:rhodanese-related sulfurtransferase
MLFCELNLGKCKTYLVADEGSRKAALIDPLKEKVDRYLAVLAYHGCTLDEFRGELGHVPGAILIPLRELPARAAELIAASDSDVIVICRAGVRSATAAAILTGLGFDHVSNLKGGMLDWYDANLPVER